MEDYASHINDIATNPDYILWTWLRQTSDAIHKARDKELKKYGATSILFGVLFIIQAIGDRATPAEISRWLFREPHSVSGLLSRMEKGGLVRRVKDLEKKNMVRVIVTEKGRQACHEAQMHDRLHEIMSSLSEEQRQQLRSSLQTLRDTALQELRVERKPLFPPS